MPAAHAVAVVNGTDGPSAQALLAAAAASWRAEGARVVGLVAESHGLPDRTCSAGILRDIVSGTPYPIYLETAPSDTTCHLDAAGVEMARAGLLGQIGACDLVVLSKFGKLEAAHAGLAGAFEAARAAGKPVLTTVSARHRDAWQAFAPEAVYLPAEAAALRRWWRALPPDRPSSTPLPSGRAARPAPPRGPRPPRHRRHGPDR